MRTRVIENLKEIFTKIDAIASPTTGQTAELIIDGDDAGTWKFEGGIPFSSIIFSLTFIFHIFCYKNCVGVKNSPIIKKCIEPLLEIHFHNLIVQFTQRAPLKAWK